MNNDRYPRSSQPDEGNSFDAILKRSNGSGFNFGGLLSESIKPNSESSSSDEEKKTPSSEKTSKRSKKEFPTLLKGIFPKTLDNQKTEQAPSSVAEGIRGAITNDESISSSITETPNNTAEMGSGDEAESKAMKIELSDEADVLDSGKIGADNEKTDDKPGEDTSFSLEQDAERDLIIAQARSKIAEADNPIASPEPPRQAPPIVFESTPQVQSNSTYEAAYYSSPSVKTERVIIEKPSSKGAVLAFLGAEILSRRRDRKIRKELARQNKETKKSIDGLEKKLDQRAPESIESIMSRQQTKYQTSEKQPDIRTREQPKPVAREFVKAETNKDRIDERSNSKVINQPSINRFNTRVNILNRSESYQTNRTTRESALPIVKPEFNQGPSDMESDTTNLYSFENAPENNVYDKRRAGSNNRTLTTQAQKNDPQGIGFRGFPNNYGDDNQKISNQPQGLISNINAQYKQSAQIGAGLAILILAIFAFIYFL